MVKNDSDRNPNLTFYNFYVVRNFSPCVPFSFTVTVPSPNLIGALGDIVPKYPILRKSALYWLNSIHKTLNCNFYPRNYHTKPENIMRRRKVTEKKDAYSFCWLYDWFFGLISPNGSPQYSNCVHRFSSFYLQKYFNENICIQLL